MGLSTGVSLSLLVKVALVLSNQLMLNLYIHSFIGETTKPHIGILLTYQLVSH